MASEQSEPLASQLAGRSPMSKLVAEAWDATNVVAEQVDPATREAAFRLILEALLRNGQPSVGRPDRRTSQRGPHRLRMMTNSTPATPRPISGPTR